MAQMSQGYREPSTSGAVAATVGCSVLGMVVAGPLGAMVGAGLAVAATQPNANMFPLLQRGRHTIANVSLPRDGMTKQQGVTYFAVDVVDINGFTWRLLRRYSHFSRFQALMNNYEIRCVFPGKTFFGCSGNELEQRRLALEAWTRDMLRVFSSTGIPNRLQAEFAVEVPGGVHAGQQLMVKNPMDGSSFLITVPLGTGPGSILQVSPPADASGLGVAVPSSSPVQAPAAPAAGEQKILLSISIPPGVSAGQTLGVKVPDGRELTVVVPPGLGQQEVQLEYDAVSGSLDVVTSQPSAPAAPSAPPAPAPVAAMAPMAPAAGGEHFNFRIPRGVVPGQIVKIQVPDGRYLPLLIPNYKFAGDDILLRLDSAGSKLVIVA